MSRITLITKFNDEQLSKITKKLPCVSTKLCKVPYGVDDDNRYQVDNLPYHLTIFATDKMNQEKLIDIVKSIQIEPIAIIINDIRIMGGYKNSLLLYFSINENYQLRQLQSIFYKNMPNKNYNPDNFIFHMTIHVDKDVTVIYKLLNELKNDFKPLKLQFDELSLYDYPGDIIDNFKLIKSKNKQ